MLSLSVKNIEDFAVRAGIENFDTSNFSSDASGDYIIALDPDTNFSSVKRKIVSNHILNKKIVNQGVLFVELFDSIWVDGNRTNVAILVECGIGKLGTKIKIMVKSVEVNVKGQIKQFLSFESYKNYKELIQS